MSGNRHPFYALALAEIVSLSGTRLSMIAVPWLVLTTTGDPVWTGIVAMAEMLPMVLFQALGGPLIDRLGARRIAIAGDLGAVVAIALIPALHMLGALNIFVLVPIVALMGAMRGPADAAKHAMVPAVAAAGGLPLERVTGIAGTIERLAGALGAGLAGGLVALLGPIPALAINTATFLISALIMIFGMKLPSDRIDADTAEAAPAGYLADLNEGWTYLRKSDVLLGIVVMVAITNFLDQAYSSVMLPVWTQQTGHGADTLGMLFAAFSAASVAGALLATALGERLPRLPVYAICFLITGLPRFLVFIPEPQIMAILGVLAVAGFASGFLNPILSAVIFEHIPAKLTGRVSSLINALCFMLNPFSGVVAGLVITGLGLGPSFAGAGLLYFAATMLPLTLKSFRGFSDRAQDPAPGHTA